MNSQQPEAQVLASAISEPAEPQPETSPSADTTGAFKVAPAPASEVAVIAEAMSTDSVDSDPPVEAPLEPLHIGIDGKWFRVGEKCVDLSRRRPLTRILWAMARGTTPLAAADLIAAGWPGERIVRHAARIRLRVAVATLRSMGLARHIVTTRTGYTLGCRVAIETARPDAGGPETREHTVLESGIPPHPGDLEREAG